jgi:hypothetical protein
MKSINYLEHLQRESNSISNLTKHDGAFASLTELAKRAVESNSITNLTKQDGAFASLIERAKRAVESNSIANLTKHDRAFASMVTFTAYTTNYDSILVEHANKSRHAGMSDPVAESAEDAQELTSSSEDTALDIQPVSVPVLAVQSEPVRPQLNGLVAFADYFGLGMRARIKALAGDFDAEIARLHRDRRYKTAKWNQFLAWWFTAGYLLRGPFDWAWEYFVEAFRSR